MYFESDDDADTFVWPAPEQSQNGTEAPDAVVYLTAGRNRRSLKGNISQSSLLDDARSVVSSTSFSSLGRPASFHESSEATPQTDVEEVGDAEAPPLSEYPDLDDNPSPIEFGVAEGLEGFREKFATLMEAARLQPVRPIGIHQPSLDYGRFDLDEDELLGSLKEIHVAMNACEVFELFGLNTKVVVFDERLTIKSALEALYEHGLRSACLWNSKLRSYTGVVTAGNFIAMFRFFDQFKQHFPIKRGLENSRIMDWTEIVYGTDAKPVSFQYISPESSVFEAARAIVQLRCYVLPCMLERTVVSMLSGMQILNFLSRTFQEVPCYVLDQSILSLDVGTFEGVVTVLVDTPLIVILNTLFERSISAVPVINESGVLLGLFTSSDVSNLADEQRYNNLDVTAGDALVAEFDKQEPNHVTCKRTESLRTVITRILYYRADRLVCVDNMNRVTGIVSVADILNFLVTTDRTVV